MYCIHPSIVEGAERQTIHWNKNKLRYAQIKDKKVAEKKLR